MNNKSIAIVVALRKETIKLIEKLNFRLYKNYAGKNIYKTTYNKNSVYIIISGIGKVNASISTQIAIDVLKAQKIINFGTCGGLYPNVRIKKFYKIKDCFQYDFDLSKLDKTPIGYIQDYKTETFGACIDYDSELPIKKLATADKFTYLKRDIKLIQDNNCDVFDMEGCAIAETCMANNVPLYIIKGVSDIYGSTSQKKQYEQNSKYLRENFPKHIIDLLDKIL